MGTRNEELIQLVIEILTRTGVTRAWRLGFELGAELVVVLESWEFERIDADRLTEQLVEGLGHIQARASGRPRTTHLSTLSRRVRAGRMTMAMSI